ncbi:hypothetical protein RU639_001133 [Aspergillus parasiticus]
MSSVTNAARPYSSSDDKTSAAAEHLEDIGQVTRVNFTYEVDEEPEIHARTWFALAAMFLLNMVQVFGLLGPPAALSYIETDLNNTASGTWVPNSLSLVQAVLAPLIASVSDTFQARKLILVGSAVIAFVGSGIAPRSTSIYQLIGAQVLIGVGFATVPLAYSVPSEILPKRWRPLAQAFANTAAGLGACSGPLIIGAFTKANLHTGWRDFYWIQMALWGATALGLLVGYSPPRRQTALDQLSVWEKIGRLDLLGFVVLTAGLTLLLTGLNLGGALYPWVSAPVLVTLVLGVGLLVAFGGYEWKFTQTGILHHELFRTGKDRGRTFGICVGLIFIEGILLFAYVLFYPVLISNLFETDPFLASVRQVPYWIASVIGTVIYGYVSSRYRTIRGPAIVGFLFLTGGIVGLATIQPNDNINTWMFAALAGFGFGAPLILMVTGVQLSTPHHLIATATAVSVCSRSIAATVFTAIFTAAMDARLQNDIPTYITERALQAGLPSSSLEVFIQAISSQSPQELVGIPGITPGIIQAGYAGLKEAYADGIRVVFIIAAPFGAVACVAAFFLSDMKEAMNYGVDAPVEELHAKRRAA